MKIKTVEVNGTTYAVLSEGKPVYVTDDGKEIALDGAELSQKITHLKQEADKAFKARDEAKSSLRKYESIEDVDAAIKALETVAALSQKKLIDAGEVEKVKQEVAKGFETQLNELRQERDSLQTTLHREMIGGRFSRSPLLVGDQSKVAIPPDMVESKFGTHFKVEDGKIVARDSNGEKVYSRTKPGELADFDEALELLIEAYPHKDHIVKAPGASGGNAPGGRPNGAQKFDPEKLGGSREERSAAIAARFPELKAGG